MNALARIWHGFKALTGMQWPKSTGWWSMLLGSTTFDYRAAAGDGRTNAAVMACVRWAQRTLPEAPLVVSTRNRQGELTPVSEHPLTQLLETPNGFYSGLDLVGAVLADLMLSGNAYLFKVRSANRRVRELWWAPASLVEPKWPDTDPSIYISHYEYRVEGSYIVMDPADVIHFRQGFDPHNVRKGASDLASLYREIATDNEGANWTGSLLRNGAVPGVVLSPEGDVVATSEELAEVKDTFARRFGGDERGAPMVMKGATKVQVLSFNPEQMNLRELRIVPEERITAVLGIPAIVVGLGAGLQRSTFANYAEAREAAYEGFVIPMQRLLASTLQSQLVPEFGDPATLRIQFDLAQVRVLQQDENALHERARADLLAGGITLNQYLGAIGEEPLSGPEGDVRYLPKTITVTPAERLIPAEAPEADQVPASPDPSLRPSLRSRGASRTGVPVAEDGEPPRTLVAVRASNGHAVEMPAGQRLHGGAAPRAKAADLGPALMLSEEDLDRVSRVGPDDVPAAERFWRQVVDDELDDLLDARPHQEGAD